MIGMNSAFGRSGAHDFKMQRLSAGILMLFLIFLVYSTATISEFNYDSWSAIFAPMWVKVFTFLAVVSISVHAWAGLWIVSTDYLKPPAIRNMFQLIVLLVCLGLIVWTGLILFSGVS